ncbi:hydrolase 2, exosortase A system-associated [Pseudoduganella sp. LjRoot289]|uniref:hydrolase 2, exosortase A system-associated n=1 Tax=Pseudoduganella sp. LjRoot289 TaxID=3342314 RepID=UPI003ECCE393
MTLFSPAAHAQPFFLKAAAGERYCLFHPAAGLCRGGMVYLHPFGEEMNKSRRMAALQARALAAQGIAVLQIDLYGCGDSGGDFADARWEHWLDDAALGCQWLAARLGRPVGLWGLRLGALLALDYARRQSERGAAAPQRLLLWQPVHSGSAFLTQFLRLRMANAMLAEDGAQKTGTAALREQLRAGEALEVAGYELAPELAGALDALELAKLPAPPCPVHWFDVVAAEGRPLAPASAKLTAAWLEQGVALQAQAVAGQQFWGTQEIAICEALIEASSAALGDGAGLGATGVGNANNDGANGILDNAANGAGDKAGGDGIRERRHAI